MAQLGFDASAVEPSAPFEVLPPGKYQVQIVQSEMRPTRAGDGQFLWLEMDILAGPHAGRKLWDQLNLVNRSQQTVEIAQRRLSAICHAVGRLQVADSEELHFRPMLATVKVKPEGPDKQGVHRQAKNEIEGYEPLPGAPARPAAAPARPAAAPARPAAAPSAPHAPPPASGSVPPWRRPA